MLIEYAIPDPHGAELWKSRFLGKDEVSWPKFVSTFAEDDRFGAATISPHSPPVRCLKNLLGTQRSLSSSRSACDVRVLWLTCANAAAWFNISDGGITDRSRDAQVVRRLLLVVRSARARPAR